MLSWKLDLLLEYPNILLALLGVCRNSRIDSSISDPHHSFNRYSCHLWGTHLMYAVIIHHMDDVGLWMMMYSLFFAIWWTMVIFLLFSIYMADSNRKNSNGMETKKDWKFLSPILWLYCSWWLCKHMVLYMITYCSCLLDQIDQYLNFWVFFYCLIFIHWS